MTQPTHVQLRENLRELAASMRMMSLRAGEEATRCNATLAAIHPENVTPMAFAELKNVTRELSEIYVWSLGRLAESLEEMAADVGWEPEG